MMCSVLCANPRITPQCYKTTKKQCSEFSVTACHMQSKVMPFRASKFPTLIATTHNQENCIRNFHQTQPTNNFGHVHRCKFPAQVSWASVIAISLKTSSVSRYCFSRNPTAGLRCSSGVLSSCDGSRRWKWIMDELRGAVRVEQRVHLHRRSAVLARVITRSCTWAAVRRWLVQFVAASREVFALLDGVGMHCKVDTDTGSWSTSQRTQHTHR